MFETDHDADDPASEADNKVEYTEAPPSDKYMAGETAPVDMKATTAAAPRTRAC